MIGRALKYNIARCSTKQHGLRIVMGMLLHDMIRHAAVTYRNNSLKELVGLRTTNTLLHDTPQARRNEILFPDTPCMKRAYKEKEASVHWSAPRKKERVSSRGYVNQTSTGRQPDVNRSSTGRFVPLRIGLHWTSFVRASEQTFRTVVYDAREGNKDGYLLGGPLRRRPVLTGPAAAPPCAASTRPARGMSRFWIRQM